MALVERREATASDLRWFGLMLSTFLAIMGGVLHWRGVETAALVLWVAAATVLVVYAAVPTIRRPLVQFWGILTLPISWLITHVLVGAVYYLVMTPIALIMRVLGRCPLELRFDPSRETYWVKRSTPPAERYFKQF